ncbi:MAG: flagellar export protein FliJ [Deltaproteobacteria bacterium]|nr:flagellar export protein FliJ [Deltaproteobacteria bacterium]
MGFKFRYESSIAYRSHLKEKAGIELAKAQTYLRECNDLMRSYQESLLQAGSDLDKDLRAGIPSHVLKSHSGYIAGLEKKIEVQSRLITRARNLVNEKLKILQAKTTECRIFEKLKEKDLKKWNHQQNHREQKETNETAVLRCGRDYLPG